jgi:hypothetical protein
MRIQRPDDLGGPRATMTSAVGSLPDTKEGRHEGRPRITLPVRSRRVADSNCCTRLCRPLPNHSANTPGTSASTPHFITYRTELRSVTAVGCVRFFTGEPACLQGLPSLLARVAQPVEHDVANVEVAGSTPAARFHLDELTERGAFLPGVGVAPQLLGPAESLFAASGTGSTPPRSVSSSIAAAASCEATQTTRRHLIRWLPILCVAVLLLAAPTARSGTRSVPQPARLAAISQHVFGARWRTAACIAHYESTDGAHLFNGVNLGPWQINVTAHPWVDRRRVVNDWWYSARVAWRVSGGGRDWSPWSTHRLCGV